MSIYEALRGRLHNASTLSWIFEYRNGLPDLYGTIPNKYLREELEKILVLNSIDYYFITITDIAEDEWEPYANVIVSISWIEDGSLYTIPNYNLRIHIRRDS